MLVIQGLVYVDYKTYKLIFTILHSTKYNELAIDLIFHKEKNHETYNIRGFNEWQNIDLVKLFCQQMDAKLGREKGESEKLITYVKDRPSHDLRYVIDASKINKELGWKPSVAFEQGLERTID